VARHHCCATSYQAEPDGGRAAGEGLASPSGGGGPPLEADLVIAGGATSEVRVALGVSSWNGGRRPCGGVLDLRVDWGGRLLRGLSGWTSIWSGSISTGLSWGEGAGRALVGGGRSGQSLLLAEWASPQLEHLAGEARQQLRMALRLPPLGHEGLGQRCSAFVCWREHRGHVGVSALQRGLTWPYFQHFWHWVIGEDE